MYLDMCVERILFFFFFVTNVVDTQIRTMLATISYAESVMYVFQLCVLVCQNFTVLRTLAVKTSATNYTVIIRRQNDIHMDSRVMN